MASDSDPGTNTVSRRSSQVLLPEKEGRTHNGFQCAQAWTCGHGSTRDKRTDQRAPHQTASHQHTPAATRQAGAETGNSLPQVLTRMLQGRRRHTMRLGAEVSRYRDSAAAQREVCVPLCPFPAARKKGVPRVESREVLLGRDRRRGGLLLTGTGLTFSPIN